MVTEEILTIVSAKAQSGPSTRGDLRSVIACQLIWIMKRFFPVF
jgi:hypothetical protein